MEQVFRTGIRYRSKILLLIRFGLYIILVKKQYRSEIGIVGDILDVTADAGRSGALVSEITRFANLSHYVALAKCDKLVNAGLVRPDKNGRSRVFLITDKGRQFIDELEKFRGVAHGLNLRF